MFPTVITINGAIKSLLWYVSGLHQLAFPQRAVERRKSERGASPQFPNLNCPTVLFCLLISCPLECSGIVNFAFVGFVNLYRPLLLPPELFHYQFHRLKPPNSSENLCRSTSPPSVWSERQLLSTYFSSLIECKILSYLFSLSFKYSKWSFFCLLIEKFPVFPIILSECFCVCFKNWKPFLIRLKQGTRICI